MVFITGYILLCMLLCIHNTPPHMTKEASSYQKKHDLGQTKIQSYGLMLHVFCNSLKPKCHFHKVRSQLVI